MSEIRGDDGRIRFRYWWPFWAAGFVSGGLVVASWTIPLHPILSMLVAVLVVIVGVPQMLAHRFTREMAK